VRIFVAIDLPHDLKKEIFPVAKKISEEIPLRLVANEILHLTLVFLGERNENQVEQIKKALKSVTEGFSPFTLVLENLVVFPDNKRPRGIWFNLGGQKEKYFSLYKKVVDGLLKSGLKLEEKYFEYSPHCTIGRFPEKIKMPGNINQKINWVNLNKDFLVKKIILYQSKLSSSGPTYFKLAEFKLQ
jgi:2'-5' RNA ligase